MNQTLEVRDTNKSQTTASILLPTYCEAENIVSVIEQCQDALKDYVYEIIVIDDNSPDGTWRIAEETFLEDERVQVIRRTDESGLATAVVCGFNAATHDIAVVMDADLQHPPGRLPEILDAFSEETDLVIGSRYAAGGCIEDWPLYRHIVSRGATLLSKLAVPSARGVSDPMSGYFAVRRRAVIGAELDPMGYKILLEVLARGDIDTVDRVGIEFQERERGESKLTSRQYRRFLDHLGSLVVHRWRTCSLPPQRRTVTHAITIATLLVGSLALFLL